MTTRDTTPVWNEIQRPAFGPLRASGRYDVVVVGGGIAGLSAAYFLKRSGKRVCLLERDRIGSGDTGHTTAHLTYVIDVRLRRLVEHFGKERAALAWYGGACALDLIEQIVNEHGISCDFRRVPGFLHASLEGTDDESEELTAEADVARSLGFDVEFVANVPVVNKPGIRVRDQAKFHPLAYLGGLAQLVDGDGSAIHERTEVTDIETDPIVVVSNEMRIDCDYVVIATHVPLIGKSSLLNASLLQTKLVPYSSYVISGSLPKGTAPDVSLWDTSNPYYYLRVDSGPELDRVIFGGNDHKTGQTAETDDCYRRLERKLREILPSVTVDHRWSGQVIETNDGLPFIGESSDQQFVATGFNGNGITFATLAGMMARDAMLDRENPWQDLFSVDRKYITGGTWDYIRENLDFPYYLIADRLKPAKRATPDSLERGQGEVIKIDGKRVACSRDDNGRLHQVSAICTHLGCVVRWNVAERTWDCPCHGSRFQATGEVLSGPAETPLAPVETPQPDAATSKSPT